MQQTQSDRSLRSHKPRGMKSPKLDKAENPENTQNSIKSITYKIPAKSISPEKDKQSEKEEQKSSSSKKFSKDQPNISSSNIEKAIDQALSKSQNKRKQKSPSKSPTKIQKRSTLEKNVKSEQSVQDSSQNKQVASGSDLKQSIDQSQQKPNEMLKMASLLIANKDPAEKRFISLFDVVEAFNSVKGDFDAKIEEVYAVSQNMVHNSSSFNERQIKIKEKILEGLDSKYSGQKVKDEESESASDTEMDDQSKITKSLCLEMERIAEINEMVDQLILQTTQEKLPSFEESKCATSMKSNRSRSKNKKKEQNSTKQSRIKKKISDDNSNQE